MTGRKAVINEVQERLWKIADDVSWMGLSPATKNRYYDNWANDPDIGQRIARVLSPGKERSYIKDTLMKRYTRDRMSDPRPYLRLVGLPDDAKCRQRLSKPMGCVLADGKVLCWGQADSWKLVVLSLYERCFGRKDRTPYAVVLTHATKHFADADSRKVPEDVAKKLGGIKLIWRLE